MDIGKYAKKALWWIVVGILLITFIGYIVTTLRLNLSAVLATNEYGLLWEPGLLLDPGTYLAGVVVILLVVVLFFIFRKENEAKRARRMMKGAAQAVDGALENSRFMTDSERDSCFAAHDFSRLRESKKDGVPLRAYMEGGKLKINLAPPMHGLIIGSTGSGKTTTFINPMVQILSETQAGSSMILTDPKGELFQLHSQKLVERGYKVMVLDLRDPYSSYIWNPL